jgi:hypothetical protein
MDASQTKASARGPILILAAMLFLGSAYFYQDPEWNGNSRLNLTRAIVEEGTLSIDAYHDAPKWATGDKAIYGGHYYSDKAIGASMFAVPVYFIVYHVGNGLGIALSASAVKHALTTAVMGSAFTVTGIAMYLVARRIAGNNWKAFVSTLAISFGTMLWPYSAVFYGHLPAAAFLALSFALLFAAKEPGGRHSNARWFWTGISVGLAFISDYTSALVIAGLGIYALYVLRSLDFKGKLQAAWAAAPGLALPLLLMVAYNIAVFQQPIAFGYSYEAENRFQEIMGLGIMGIRLPTLSATYHITFDPRFGVFWLSPVLLLAPIGYLAAFRTGRHRAEAFLSIYAIAVMFAMNAASYLWWGGSAFGPRLVISALPFFIVPFAVLPRAATWPLVLLGLISAANMLIPLLGQIQITKLEYKADRGGFFVADAPFKGFSLLYEYGLPQILRQVRADRPSWTLGSALGLPLGFSAVLLFIVESALALGFRRRVASTAISPAPRR